MTENLIKTKYDQKDDISIFTRVTNSIKTLIVTKNKHPLFKVKKTIKYKFAHAVFLIIHIL